MASDPLTDERIELSLGNLLRYGVLLAATTVFLGGVIHLWRHAAEPVDYHAFRGEPANLRSPIAIVRDSVDFRGRSLIQLGLLLLIGTPVARVVFSAAAFARQRDFLYVAFTLIVLAVLIYSLFLAGEPSGGSVPLGRLDSSGSLQ
jgi:uncharacterized membrane protein